MGPKILTVDDSKTIRLIIGKAFKSFDCEVFEASNGVEGLAVAAKATTLGAGISPDTAKRGLLEKAQGYANQAIKLNSNSAAAYFELARADGRLAQFVGILQSLPLASEVKNSLN